MYGTNPRDQLVLLCFLEESYRVYGQNNEQLDKEPRNTQISEKMVI